MPTPFKRIPPPRSRSYSDSLSQILSCGDPHRGANGHLLWVFSAPYIVLVNTRAGSSTFNLDTYRPRNSPSHPTNGDASRLNSCKETQPWAPSFLSPVAAMSYLPEPLAELSPDPWFQT
ncbi:hypothetical protein HYQ45_013361 [Verticillium longisporum]|uniref:Uncharacterized protein n=1 Tax=Verticillium longisporum TaxID=100787 RepID=A0A8I3ALY9_VERLO|nr:hypothetical protein HYQ45_013361 [Verticillium longisporum]